MVSCPVGSIRTVVSDPLVKQVLSEVFPAEIDPIRIPGVNLIHIKALSRYPLVTITNNNSLLKPR